MNKKYILLLLFLFLLTVSSCSKEDKIVSPDVRADDTKETNSEKSMNYIVDGAFVIGKDKKPLTIEEQKVIDQSMIIDVYFDPHCPACVVAEEIIAENFDKVTEKMYLRFYPTSFMKDKSVDGYSLNASSFILATAELFPERNYSFMTKIMNQDFYPDNPKLPVDENRIKSLFLESEGTEEEWKVILDNLATYKEIVETTTSIAYNSEYLLNLAKNGKLTIPFIIIGNSKESFIFDKDRDRTEYFMEAIDMYLKGMESRS